ncbi:MAG: hypothetical protein VYE22_09525 [Myxococcota bacterium]|nr:hypothetical protein [Myxococcota bacterium]
MGPRQQVAVIGLDASRNQELARLLVRAGLSPICFTPEMWLRWPMARVKRVVWATALPDAELIGVLGPAPSPTETLVIEAPERPGRVAPRQARVATWTGDLWDVAREVQTWLRGASAGAPPRERPEPALRDSTWNVRGDARHHVPRRRQWAWLALVLLVVGLSAALATWPTEPDVQRVVLPTEPRR